MKLWNSLWVLPEKELMEKHKTLLLILLWVVGFIVVVRAFALLLFLMDLDYSEVNRVKLVQYTFVKFITLAMLVYFMRVLWSRPHRFALGLLIGLSLLSLYLYRDFVSVVSSFAIGTMAFLLYLKLHAPRRKVVAIE